MSLDKGVAAAMRAFLVCLYLCALLCADAQDPPHSYSWYSGDIAGEVDRAAAVDAPLELTKVTYLMDALRVNSERWAYIETQVMENLDIDLDMDLVQEPLQNLALAQLLLAELSFQRGGAGRHEEEEAFRALKRGCSVQALLRPDENTPHPYSHGSLGRRCQGMVDRQCPRLHPTMDGHEEDCRAVFEAVSSNKQLRASLLEDRVSRGWAGQQDAPSPPETSAPVTPPAPPVDRREYTEIASSLYETEQLMRLYTPEAPSDHPSALAAVAPNPASLSALYLCVFISLAIAAMLMNKKKPYYAKKGKHQHSLLSAKGLKEAGLHLYEVAVTVTAETAGYVASAPAACVAIVGDLITHKGPQRATGRTSVHNARPSKLSVKEQKGGPAKRSSPGSAAACNSKKAPAKFAAQSPRSSSNMSNSSTNASKKIDSPPFVPAPPGISSEATLSGQATAVSMAVVPVPVPALASLGSEISIRSESASNAISESTIKNETDVVNSIDAVQSSSSVHPCDTVHVVAPVEAADAVLIPLTQPEIPEAEAPPVDMVPPPEGNKEGAGECDYDDNSSLSSLTAAPFEDEYGRNTPSPVIPFIADYQDNIRREAQLSGGSKRSVKAENMAPSDGGMTRVISGDVLPWPGDFKLFSPTADRGTASVATFGHPTLGLVPPSEDENSANSPYSRNSWLGIDGRVHSDDKTDLNEAAQVGARRTDQDLRLYTYWGGGSAVSVNSAESSVHPRSYHQGLISSTPVDSSADLALTDTSPALSERSLFPVAMSLPPISPPKKNRVGVSPPLHHLDTSFMDQSVTPGLSGGASTGHSGVSRAFSDDVEDRPPLEHEKQSPLPIAPTLFGDGMPPPQSRKPPRHSTRGQGPTSATTPKGPPPGFEGVAPDTKSVYFDEFIASKSSAGSPGGDNKPTNRSEHGAKTASGVIGSSRPQHHSTAPFKHADTSHSQPLKINAENDTIVLQVIGMSP